MEIRDLPKDILKDIDSIKSILLDAGVTEIYLFGSFAVGEYRMESDLDIAVIGLAKSKFFKVYGKILSSVARNVDIISLDYENDFSNEIKKQTNMIRVAWLANSNVELEFKQIEAEEEIVILLNEIRKRNGLDKIQIRAAASSLHSIYNGIERILFLIIKEKKIEINQTSRWLQNRQNLVCLHSGRNPRTGI